VRVRRAGIGLVAAAALLAAAQPASAGSRWLPTVPAFSDANTVPEVAMAPDGTLAAAYTIPTVRDLWLGGPLEVRVRPPGGEFGPPTVLASDASDLRLAFGRGGHLAAVWRSDSGHYVAVRPPGGAFGPTHEVAPDGSFASIDQLAVAPDGRVWIARTILRSDVFTLGPDGGVTILPLDTGPAFTATAAPSLAVDGEGRVTVVYRHTTYVPGVAFDDPCHADYEIRVAEGGAGGFADMATLARTTRSGTMLTSCFKDGVEPIAPEVAVRPSGDAVVTYGLDQRDNYREVETRVLAHVRSAGETWPEVTSNPGLIVAKPFAPTATPAFAGATPLVLLEDALKADVALAARTAGEWSAPQLLTPKPAEQALIAGSPSGNVLIAYVDLSTACATGVVRRPDGTLSTPEPLSPPFRGWFPLIAWLSIATDDDGNGVVTSGEPEHQAWLAPYDGAGPRITAASFPAGGTIGQPLPFAATALDVWSGATTEWSFGDGETATGPDVTHAYRGPGAFTATVTALDGLANASTRSGTVAVPVPPDLTAPRFQGRGVVSPRRVRRGGAARVRFALSEAATVRTTFTARLPGVRRGRRCVVARRSTGARAAAAVRCRRTVRRALRAKRFAKSGLQELALRTRRLPPARYTLTLIAQDAAGNRSRALTLTLTVLPARRQARRPHRAG
jgi:hypothetical protein